MSDGPSLRVDSSSALRRVGDNWTTPSWCPMMAQAMERLIEELRTAALSR